MKKGKAKGKQKTLENLQQRAVLRASCVQAHNAAEASSDATGSASLVLEMDFACAWGALVSIRGVPADQVKKEGIIAEQKASDIPS